MTGARPEEVQLARDPLTCRDPVPQQTLVRHEDAGKTTAIKLCVKQVA